MAMKDRAPIKFSNFYLFSSKGRVKSMSPTFQKTDI